MEFPGLTTAQMAEVDRLMIEEYGIQLIQMMENAGRQLAHLARRLLGDEVTSHEIAILCGTGNNGGGGMVAARHLHNWGAHVQAVLVGQSGRLKEVPELQWGILHKLGIAREAAIPASLGEPDLVIDAIIGYGLQGNPRNQAAEWIAWANHLHRPILALDTPSGLDATIGRPGSPCIRAATTLTLALPKIGLLTPEAKPFVGELYLADISVPPQLYLHLGIEVGPLFAQGGILPVKQN